jgi:hypothetical protein
MGMKVAVEGNEDLQRQIELLKLYPEIFDNNFYPAMKDAAELVKNAIHPLIPVRTGYIAQTLGSRVSHSKSAALSTSATIGYGKRFTDYPAWYIGPLNTGARPHDFSGARHIFINGNWVTMTHHPGFAGRHFQEDGFEAARTAVDARMAQAAEKVVQELRVP